MQQLHARPSVVRAKDEHRLTGKAGRSGTVPQVLLRLSRQSKAGGAQPDKAGCPYSMQGPKERAGEDHQAGNCNATRRHPACRKVAVSVLGDGCKDASGRPF